MGIGGRDDLAKVFAPLPIRLQGKFFIKI